jgi:hypothetical protein
MNLSREARRRSVIAGGLAAAVAVVVPALSSADHKPGHGKPGGKGDPTIRATPNPVTFGRTTVVSGRLKGPDNSGKAVTLEALAYPFPTYGLPVTTVGTTDANGDYSFTLRPRSHTRYRVLVEGKQNEVIVNVLIGVRLSISDRTPRRGRRVRFSGRACPEHDGATLRIQRRTSTRGWRTVRRTRLRDAPRCSTYRRRFRVFRDGTFRALVNGDADHLAGASRARRVDVHR